MIELACEVKDMKRIGDKLRAAREFLGLTQDQVASTLNMTRNSIVNIENNNRSIKSEELYNFSKLYGVSMEEIVSEDTEVNMNVPAFARGFDSLSKKDQQEILNLIKFKNNYKE
jgi:transcriptional regulator with XRE-family HTH domain